MYVVTFAGDIGVSEATSHEMPRLTNRMKDEVLARVNAFPRSRMFGNVGRYYNSFVGRDFKGWAQISVSS